MVKYSVVARNELEMRHVIVDDLSRRIQDEISQAYRYRTQKDKAIHYARLNLLRELMHFYDQLDIKYD